MKPIFTTVLALFLYFTAICQLPFAPLGAVWGFHYECATNPVMQSDYNFTVTEDTVIQGKYCTRLRDDEWVCAPGAPTYVHYEDGKVYLYDVEQEEFQLIIDYTKQVDESWRIKLCPFFETDSATVQVLISDGYYRKVYITGDTGWLDHDYELYEGVGAVKGYPLLFNSDDFISHEPPCWTHTTCYLDPDLGILFGGINGSCFVSSDEPFHPASTYLNLFPNPAKDYLQVQLNSRQTGNDRSYRIVNAEGKVMKEFTAKGTDATYILPVLDWAGGAYYLQYLENEQVLQTQQFIKQ